jgi:hypothetical protein
MVEIVKERDVDLNKLIFQKWKLNRLTKIKYSCKGINVDLDMFLDLCKFGIEFELEDPMYGLMFNTRFRNQTDPRWSKIKTEKIKVIDGVFYGEISSMFPAHLIMSDIFSPLICEYYNPKNENHNKLLIENTILVPIINSDGNLETFDLGSRLWKNIKL